MDFLQFAQSLIRCPSVTPVDEGVADVLVAALEPLGFTCWKLPFQEPGSEYTVNVFARLGTQSPHFCFGGHTDVVPAGDEAAWEVPPFSGTVQGEYLIGRGAEDMKGAIACFVAAVARFLQAGQPFQGSISLLIAADEEGIAINGTRKVLEWMEANGHIPDICVVGEPTNPTFIGEMAKIGRRGSMNCVLTVHGKQGHAAYPHLADNPITKLVNILHALKHHTLDEGTEFFPPSNLEMVSVDVGNPASNVIPGQATAKFGIRFNDLHEKEALEAWIRGVCEAYAGQGYELVARTTGTPFLTQPGALSELVVEAVREATGHTPTLSTTGGTSDARFISNYCPVIEFGTTGFTPHMVNERVKLGDLELLTACYEAMLRRYFLR